MKMNEMMESRERFVSLAKDITPLITEMVKVLKDHGVSNMSSLTITPDHFSFEIYDKSGWKLGKYGNEGKIKVMNDYSEPLYEVQTETPEEA